MSPRIQKSAALACSAVLACSALAPSAAAQKAQTVVYTADQEASGRVEAFAVDLKTLDVTPLLDGSQGALGDALQPISDREGRHIVHQVGDDLFHTDLKTGVSQAVHTAADETDAAFPEATRMDPGGRSILFVTFDSAAGENELFHFDVSTGVAVKLGESERAVLDRSGRHAFFVERDEAVVVADLATCERRTLSAPLVAGGRIRRVQIDRRGRHLVYSADQHEAGVVEAFGTRVSQCDVEKLSGPLVIGGDVLDVMIDRRGRRALYQADAEIDGASELYRVESPGAVVKASVAVGGSGGVEGDAVIDRRGRHVIHAARLGAGAPMVLYASNLLSGEVSELGVLPSGGGAAEVWIGPDAKAVVLRGDDDFDGLGTYRHVVLKTGEATELEGLLGPADGAAAAIGRNGRDVVYVARDEIDAAPTLFHVDLTSGVRTAIDPGLGEGGCVYDDMRIGPKGRHAFFRAKLEANGPVGLYRADLKTLDITRLDAAPGGGSVRRFTVNGTDEHVLSM